MKKILVVDDEKDICHLVQKTLTNTGLYEVFATTSPGEVMDVCRTHRPDLILLDIVMPDMDGQELIREIRNDSATRSMLIVVTSGLGEMVYHEKKDEWKWEPNRPVVQERGEVIEERHAERAAQAYGVDDFIAKPFSPATLRAVVQEVLARQDRTSGDTIAL